MSDVVIAGVGQVPVGEHWDVSLRTLANRAVAAARQDAVQHGSGRIEPQALYIGNLLAPTLSHQANLGSLLATNSGMEGLESFVIEAAEASGAAAFHMAYLAVASGVMDAVMVVGVEKYTDVVGPRAEAAVSEITDFDYEGMIGMTPAAQAGLILQRYLYEYQAPREALGEFAILAHANAVHNPNAMYRRAIRKPAYENAPLVSDPLNLMDVAPYADGAAAILLARSDQIPGGSEGLVRITGSSVITDRLALHDRPDLLSFDAARLSVERACRQAGCLPEDVDLFELWDGFSIYAALSLEAACFAPRGQGWKLAHEGILGIQGRLPILTMGGQKGRGNPLGASGVYQLVEAALQLRGEAGKNQVPGASRAMAQSFGGAAATVVTHILERM